MSDRVREQPISLPTRAPADAAAWQLEGATSEYGPWEVVNAGVPDGTVRGRFFADHTHCRVLWANHTGVTEFGEVQVIPGRKVNNRRGERVRLVR